ncbi:MAG: CNNM domain-containing protein [Gammaproteobacteria bacterium]
MDILIILGLILLNGVFAMSEIAIVSARRGRLQRAADGGDAGAAKALQLATEPTRFLSTIQVGITLVGIQGAMGEASFVRGLEAWFIPMNSPVRLPPAWPGH